MQSGLTRRELLAAGVGSGIVGLAGCLGGDGGEYTDTATWTATATGAVDTEKPTSLPARSSLDLYSPDSPLNTPIPEEPALAPDSAGYVGLLAETAAVGDFVIELDSYSSTVWFADGSTPRTTVELGCGRPWEMGVTELRGVPIPEFAVPARDPINGAPIPPGGCGEDAGPDDQLVVFDLEARCEFDFWQMRRDGDRWVASWGNSISMDADGIYPYGLSARGSGFTTVSGLVWPSELEAGRIDHALIFSYPYPAAGGPVAPATESDGFSTRRHALPEGARVQLDPDLDLDSLDLAPHEVTIARALQEYGMFLADRGGAGAGGEATGEGGMSIEVVDPASVQGNPYAGLLPDVAFPSVGNIPVESMRVLEFGPQNPDWEEEGRLVDSGCGRLA